jgi:hypothetical protein
MLYVRELDDLPWEVRRGAAAVLRYWPKVDGRNVVASATAGHCRYAIYSPQGGVVQGEANVAPTTVNGRSALDLAVPAIATLDERYQVRVYWRPSGGAATSEVFDVRLFDCVLFPFGGPSTSLNDLLELRADARDVLDRMGQRLGYAAGDEAREYAAAICAVHGRIALEARVRDAVATDARNAPSETRPGTVQRSRFMRPALILDRARLARVERMEAMAHAYRSIALGPEESDDPASQAYRHFRDGAGLAWQQVGPLAYDESETLQGAGEVTDPGRMVRQRRVQA